MTDFTQFAYHPSAGAGVTVYVIDSGILTTHPDFEGRASWGKTFAGVESVDECGHGSHVAGTIAGKTYGVAKKASLIAVKVLHNTKDETTGQMRCSGSLNDFALAVGWGRYSE